MVIEVSSCCVSRVTVTVHNPLSPSWKFLTPVITMMMMITHHSVIIIVIILRRPELRHVERSFTFEENVNIIIINVQKNLNNKSNNDMMIYMFSRT